MLDSSHRAPELAGLQYTCSILAASPRNKHCSELSNEGTERNMLKAWLRPDSQQSWSILASTTPCRILTHYGGWGFCSRCLFFVLTL